MPVTLLDVGVAVEVQHPLLWGILVVHLPEEFGPQINVFLSPVGIMADQSIVDALVRLRALDQNLVGGIAEPRQAILHALSAAASFGHAVATTRGAKSIPSDSVAVIPVVVHADELEVQLWNGVVVGEVWEVEILPEVTVHASLVRVELIARIRLVLRGIRLCATTPSGGGIRSRALDPLVKERAQALWVVVSEVVVAENHKPGVLRKLLIHGFPRGLKSPRACSSPVEVVPNQEDEEQRGPRVLSFPVLHILLHLVCHLPLPTTAAITTTIAASIVSNDEVVIIRQLAVIASDSARIGRDVQVVRRRVKVWVIFSHRTLVIAPVGPVPIHIPVSGALLKTAAARNVLTGLEGVIAPERARHAAGVVATVAPGAAMETQAHFQTATAFYPRATFEGICTIRRARRLMKLKQARLGILRVTPCAGAVPALARCSQARPPAQGQ
mmetsp:Transcript_841/g.1621  ORF Transcript_841/g.1621 Transcript_841/m.1621 type:complete len:442 (+) Transcript_841:367-1692(+)